jgi:hypothetical protein
VQQHTFGSIVDHVEGYQGRYPRCELVEKKKIDPIGGLPWNTLGGNSENSILPLMCRPACTLYSQGNVGDREGCTAENQQGGKGKK